MKSELIEVIDLFNKNLSQLFKLAKKIDPGNLDLAFYKNNLYLQNNSSQLLYLREI